VIRRIVLFFRVCPTALGQETLHLLLFFLSCPPDMQFIPFIGIPLFSFPASDGPMTLLLSQAKTKNSFNSDFSFPFSPLSFLFFSGPNPLPE